MKRVLLGSLQLGTQEDVDCALQEVQQFVLFGMHLPLVADSGRLHGENAYVTPVELYLQELNGRLSTCHRSGLG
jgi:hypothetical protein